MAAISAPTPILPGAESFRFDAPGDTACVLTHGFTGTAHEVRYLGLHLAERGVTARGVLLAGHGTKPEEMARHSYHDWIADVERALDELLAEGKQRIFLCGLSMGGTLSLNVAARRSHDPRIAGIISLAAPLRLADWRLSFLPVARLVLRWHSWGKPDIRDQTQWERHVAYSRFHVRVLAQLLFLLQDTRQRISSVHQPLLIIHSRLDNTVAPFNADLILRQVASQQRKLIWLENCFHVLTLDYDSEQVHQEVTDFIQEHA